MYLFIIDSRRVSTETRYFEGLMAELKSCGLVREVREVESNAAAEQVMTQVIQKDSFQTVVAVGDDAFLACVAGAALQSHVAIGYIPIGSKINFGESLALSGQPDKIASLLAARRLRPFDLLKIGRYYAVDSVHIGMLQSLYQPVQEALSPLRQFWREQAMLFSKILTKPRRFDLTLTIDKFHMETRATHLMMINGQRLWGHPILTHDVDPGDGLFNAFVIGEVSRFELWSLLKHFGEQLTSKSPRQITHLRLKACEVRLGDMTVGCIDGHELPLERTLRVQLIAGAFRLIV